MNLSKFTLGLSFFLSLSAFAARPFADPLDSPVFTADLVSESVQMVNGASGLPANQVVTKVELGTYLWPNWKPLAKRAMNVFVRTVSSSEQSIEREIVDKESSAPSVDPLEQVENWILSLDGRALKIASAQVTFIVDQERTLVDAKVSYKGEAFGFEAAHFHDPALSESR